MNGTVALYLVQHGKSLPKEEDPERGLSPEGLTEVEGIADAAKTNGIRVARIDHSGKKRARQTADLFASALQNPPQHARSDALGSKPAAQLDSGHS